MTDHEQEKDLSLWDVDPNHGTPMCAICNKSLLNTGAKAHVAIEDLKHKDREDVLRGFGIVEGDVLIDDTLYLLCTSENSSCRQLAAITPECLTNGIKIFDEEILNNLDYIRQG